MWDLGKGVCDKDPHFWVSGLESPLKLSASGREGRTVGNATEQGGKRWKMCP